MSTIVTIASGDLISNSRADINSNFAALNADKIETSVLDTDSALANNSDAKVATQKAVKAYIDALGSLTVKTSGVSAGPTASATQTITHSLGRIPTVIRITGYGGLNGGTSTQKSGSSTGTYNSSGNRCVYILASVSTDDSLTATSTAYAIHLSGVVSGPTVASGITGVIQNVTSTSFDIVWTAATDISTLTAFIWEAN